MTPGALADVRRKPAGLTSGLTFARFICRTRKSSFWLCSRYCGSIQDKIWVEKTGKYIGLGGYRGVLIKYG